MSLRRILTGHPRVAATLLLLALAMRVAVPAGFMPVAHAGAITLAICDGTGAAAMPAAPATAMPAMAMPTVAMPPLAIPATAHGRHDVPRGEAPHDTAGAPCAFAALALPVVGGAAPAVAIPAPTYDVAPAASRPAALVAPPRRHLRPPLRGPPAAA